tara:strand:- start:293 stop:439 length:147 start_codon:yes stop_codon:yes gene_type:complete
MKKKIPIFNRFLLYLDEFFTDMTPEDAIIMMAIALIVIFSSYSVFYVF